MSLRIYTTKDPEVREVSSEIDIRTITNPDMQIFFDELIDAMIRFDGIGIAAPQVGHTIRAVVIAKEYAKTDQHLILINPRIASTSKKTWLMEEGCLSVPLVTGVVERPVKARIKAYDRAGVPVDIKAKGMLARILQHEVDHLNGILFIDKATSIVTHETEPVVSI